MSTLAVPLILASSSPRRSALLARLGLEVRIVVPDVDETELAGETPDAHARRVARSKAEAVALSALDLPVLAADTVVAIGGRILGKPADRHAASRMLRELSGATHEVVTAVCLLYRGRDAERTERAEVTFVPANDDLLDWYVATGEGDDKAGAYAIQGAGALLVERVEGNVQAVVGLPLAPLPALFVRVGLELRRDGDRLVLRTPDRNQGAPRGTSMPRVHKACD